MLDLQLWVKETQNWFFVRNSSTMNFSKKSLKQKLFLIEVPTTFVFSIFFFFCIIVRLKGTIFQTLKLIIHQVLIYRKDSSDIEVK